MREEDHTTILHDDMTLDRLMVYAQSIKECKIRRISRNLKRDGSSNLEQTRLKKRSQTQEKPKRVKVKVQKGGGSQNVKVTCVTCGKKYYGECLLGIRSCYCCGE